MNLTRLGWRFDCLSRSLQLLAYHAFTKRREDPGHFQSAMTLVIVRLLDEWAMKCRSIVLVSASGKAHTSSGPFLMKSPLLQRGEAPIEALRRKWSPKKPMGHSWEPRWHDAAEAIRAASILSIGNEVTLTNALGAGLGSEQLRVVRNAVVHSLPKAQIEFRKFLALEGLPLTLKPYQVGFEICSSSSVCYLDLWASELRSILYAATS